MRKLDEVVELWFHWLSRRHFRQATAGSNETKAVCSLIRKCPPFFFAVIFRCSGLDTCHQRRENGERAMLRQSSPLKKNGSLFAPGHSRVLNFPKIEPSKIHIASTKMAFLIFKSKHVNAVKPPTATLSSFHMICWKDLLEGLPNCP
jgi:hypothetical protein